jgi:hypothetical protein
MKTITLPLLKLSYSANEVINFVAKTLNVNSTEASRLIMQRGSLVAISFIEANTLIVKDDGQLVAVSVSKKDDNRFEVTSRNLFGRGTAIAIQEANELAPRGKRHGTKSLEEILGSGVRA